MTRAAIRSPCTIGPRETALADDDDAALRDHGGEQPLVVADLWAVDIGGIDELDPGIDRGAEHRGSRWLGEPHAAEPDLHANKHIHVSARPGRLTPP